MSESLECEKRENCSARVKKGYKLRNRKHVHCFYRAIETRVKVWSAKNAVGTQRLHYI